MPVFSAELLAESSGQKKTCGDLLAHLLRRCFQLWPLCGSSTSWSGQKACWWLDSTSPRVVCWNQFCLKWRRQPSATPQVSAGTVKPGCLATSQASTLCVCGAWQVAISKKFSRTGIVLRTKGSEPEHPWPSFAHFWNWHRLLHQGAQTYNNKCFQFLWANVVPAILPMLSLKLRLGWMQTTGTGRVFEGSSGRSWGEPGGLARQRRGRSSARCRAAVADLVPVVSALRLGRLVRAEGSGRSSHDRRQGPRAFPFPFVGGLPVCACVPHADARGFRCTSLNIVGYP